LYSGVTNSSVAGGKFRAKTHPLLRWVFVKVLIVERQIADSMMQLSTPGGARSINAVAICD